MVNIKHYTEDEMKIIEEYVSKGKNPHQIKKS